MMGKWAIGLTLLLGAAVSTAQTHPARTGQLLSQPHSFAPRKPVATSFNRPPPLPVRFAAPVQRGASPQDPVAARREAEEALAAAADALPDAAAPGRQPFDPFASFAVPFTDATPARDDPPQPARSQYPAESSRRDSARLLLEASLPRVAPGERLPVFELPAGSGASFHLPILPTDGHGTITPPHSSATFNRTD